MLKLLWTSHKSPSLHELLLWRDEGWPMSSSCCFCFTSKRQILPVEWFQICTIHQYSGHSIMCYTLHTYIHLYVGVFIEACPIHSVCSLFWVLPSTCLRLLSPAISWGTDSRRELTLRQNGASWMTALLCCRILSTSLSGDTRGTLSCVCWMKGGRLVLVVMWIGIVEPQDMSVLHTKTRQRWSGHRRVVEGSADQIVNICLFSSLFSLSLFLFSASHFPPTSSFLIFLLTCRHTQASYSC